LSKIFFVLFPGAFGNQEEKYIDFWFQHVIQKISQWAEVSEREIHIVKICYQGKTLEHCVRGILKQVENIPDGTAIPICYSMGGPIMECVAMKRPKLFVHPIGIATTGLGMTLGGIFKTLFTIWNIFLVGLFTQTLIMTPRAIDRLFFGGRGSEEEKKEIVKHIHPQSIWMIFELIVLLLFRTFNGKKEHPSLSFSLFFSATVLVPAKCPIASHTRFGTNVSIVQIPNTYHGVILQKHFISPFLEKVLKTIL